MSPPRPWVSVLRASSLAAVTILVWSTRLKPSSFVRRRTACRAMTTSWSVRTGRMSAFKTGIGRNLGDGRPQSLHPELDVQRGVHAGEREPQLDQRDRDVRLHPDD